MGTLTLSFAAGELRFDGCKGNIKPTGDEVEMPYSFSFSKSIYDPDDDETDDIGEAPPAGESEPE